MSRIYGGIHYIFSDTLGASLGQRCAQNTLDLFGSVATAVHMNASSGTIGIRFDQEGRLLVPDEPSGLDIEVFDRAGRKLFRRSFQEAVSVSGLAPGLYLARLVDDLRSPLRFVIAP